MAKTQAEEMCKKSTEYFENTDWNTLSEQEREQLFADMKEHICALAEENESLKADLAIEQAKETESERLLRLQADFDNFRKRNEKIRAQAVEDGESYVLEKLFPVLDNLDYATGMIKDEASKQGVAMILKQFGDFLSSAGVEEISALGEPFDPMLHNAVMQGTADENFAADTVCEVFQKGYKFKGRVLRHSCVKVAK